VRSFIVGTAGHIDHGKSALVLALTGTDPDRLKEEKERGITIDLGFAHADLGGGVVASFIDVPGHERFVRNMLAGAHGVDAVLLVVAADESVMPQTREHFHICRLLGIPRGLVALTKCDLADAETQALAEMEVRELVAGSFLAGAPVLKVSARTGLGLDGIRRCLLDLARQAGIAAHAVRLTADLKRLTVDLQRSREHLVTAREEERRRLRRDLHDGLGPQLASLTLKLETARNRLAHDSLADTLLSDLAQRTQVTVADIRRLVYALRPPALDELGLLSALRELTLLSSDQVVMHLDAPDCLPELPAAVEVAVYRITQEALTNVVRHAHAHHCDMCLTLDETAGRLSLSIQDDGCGLPPSRGVGVGLFSMRERAEELGGTWTIEQVSSGGTRVLARLPYLRSQTVGALVVTPSMVPQEE